MCAMVTAGRIRAAIETMPIAPASLIGIYSNAKAGRLVAEAHSVFRCLLGSDLTLAAGIRTDGVCQIKVANSGPPDDLREPDRLEIAYIHTNVKLARKRLQLSMAVAVKVDRAPTHVPPSSKRVVAEHQPRSIDGDFRIRLHALPGIVGRDGRIVVVAGDEVLLAVQHPQQSRNALWRLANGKVSQVPKFVANPDHGVPAIDHHPIHLVD
jgi:hypothetical protein